MSLLGGHSPKEWEPGSPYSQENGDLESPFYGIPIFPWHCMVSLDPRPNPRGRVWGKTLPGSVLSTEMPPSVLMRERTSLQPTSVRVRLMTGSEYTVEHRNFENWSSAWPIALKIWKRKFAEFERPGIPARHFRARLFPRPFLAGWVWGPDYDLLASISCHKREVNITC